MVEASCWHEPAASQSAGQRPRREHRPLITAVDGYTGAPLSGLVQSASIQEVAAYEPTLERVQRALGRPPLAVVADRGFSHKGVFEYNTRRGIATVIPYRRHGITNHSTAACPACATAARSHKPRTA